MNNQETKDWYLGLDIGTGSVGFCATDTEYNILTKNAKLQCGARLFEEAKDASTRRSFRSIRRRAARRKVRRNLLQELFAQEIANIDPSFFIRLNESGLQLDDKGKNLLNNKTNQGQDLTNNPSVCSKYPLFCDPNFTDKDYFHKFPTIYHLKQHLLKNSETDPRLLYLACWHTIKYRGHFLADDFNADRSDQGYKTIVDSINQALKDTLCNDDEVQSIEFDTNALDQIAKIIQDKSKSEAKQYYDIRQKLNPTSDKILNALFDIMQGKKIRLSKVYKEEKPKGDKAKTALETAESEALKDFQFGTEKYEECLQVAEALLTDDQLGLLSLLKQFFDLVKLDRVMNGADYISQAMVQRYDQHKQDLKDLKKYISKYHSQDEYDLSFRENTKFVDKGFAHASYVNYIGTNLTHNQKSISHFIMCVSKGKEPMTASYEDFLRYTNDLLLNQSTDKTDDFANYKDYIAKRADLSNKNKMDSTEYQWVQNQIKQITETNDKIKDLDIIITKLQNKTLCSIHNTSENAYVPHQLNQAELTKILQKQLPNFPFLAKIDPQYTNKKNEPYTVADKIISLLTFRIPYYVGPLNEKHKIELISSDKNQNLQEQNGTESPNTPQSKQVRQDTFCWVSKTPEYIGKRVTPWNFSKAVDLTASGELFIARMTSKCTYLRAEDVIPKASLLYQKYMLLNDLNNLKIDGNRIKQPLKEFLYNSLCQKELSLSKAKIKKHLVDNCKIEPKTTVGKEDANDIAFNSALSSFVKCKDILGNDFDPTMVEQIIKWHTVFSQEKKPVEQRIKAEYGERLTDAQIGKLSKLQCKGWAKLSAKLLNGITATDKETGETSKTILSLLQDTTLNLMEILNSDRFEPKFLDTIKQANSYGDQTTHNYDTLVKDLYCSPIVKRSIWQAVLISKELAKINGCNPQKVFVEVTRAEDLKKKGKLTTSRRDYLDQLLQKAVKTGCELTQVMGEFNARTDEKEFRSERVYLYFTQLGKCMYTGEPINLADVNNNNLYDVDHIYPQSLIKDDSLRNKVLVTRESNAIKSDRYPIAKSIQTKMSCYWQMLQSKGLIDKEKFERLTKTQALTNDMISGFINRQLVSTNQAVKETINVLDKIFNANIADESNKTKMVFSKANNVSEFRHQHELIKCREVNNLHHAHDAYLNIIVGNVWDSTFAKYWQNNDTFNEDRALDKLFKYEKENIWNPKYMDKVKSYLFDNRKYRNKFVVTKMPYVVTGEFYDQTIHQKGNTKAGIRLKQNLDTAQYGCFVTDNTAYTCIIQYDDIAIKKAKNKSQQDQIIVKKQVGLFGVPLRYTKQFERFADSNTKIIEQVARDNDLKNPKVIVPQIKMFSVLEVDSVRYHMRAKDIQGSVTTEWQPDKQIIQIVHDIVRYNRLVKDKQITPDKDTMGDIEFATRQYNPKSKESKKITRENNLKFYDAIIEQIKKPIYAGYGFAKKLADGKIDHHKFEQLKTAEQLELLMSLLNLITMNGTLANAAKIGGAANEPSKIFPNTKSFFKDGKQMSLAIINQSVTGLFEKRIVIIPKANA